MKCVKPKCLTFFVESCISKRILLYEGIGEMSQKKKDFLFSLGIVSLGFVLLLMMWGIAFLIGKQDVSFFKSLFRLDAAYYDYIVRYGYHNEGNTAMFRNLNDIFVMGCWNAKGVYCFFPLYPLLISLFYFISFKTISPNIIGCCLSFVFLVFFLFMVVRYLRMHNKKVNWWLVSILFVFNQVMIYFYSMYTESIFMLLAILVIYFADKKQYVWSGFCGALLTATRVTGILFMFYLFFRILQHNKQLLLETKGSVKWYQPFFHIFVDAKQLVALALFPLGLACFMLYLNYVQKVPVLAFSDMQTAWGRTSNFIGYNIYIKLTRPTKRIVQAVFAIVFFIFLVYLLFKKKYLSSFILFLLAFVSLRTSVESFDRYAIGMVIMLLEIYNFYLSACSDQNKKRKIMKYCILGLICVCFVGLNIANLIVVFMYPTTPNLIY